MNVAVNKDDVRCEGGLIAGGQATVRPAHKRQEWV